MSGSMSELSAAEWDAAYVQVLAAIATEIDYQCREMTDHPLERGVRCKRPPHDNTHQHMTLVAGVAFSWTDNEHNCVRYRRERELAREEGRWI